MCEEAEKLLYVSELPQSQWDNHLAQFNYTPQSDFDNLIWARDWGHEDDVRASPAVQKIMGDHGAYGRLRERDTHTYILIIIGVV